MNGLRVPLIMFCVALLVICQFARADENCPRTTFADKTFSEPWPQEFSWFGSEAFAAAFPKNGIWPTTAPGRGIAVKLFWYPPGFEPGMEQNFVGRIERLDDGPNDAVISPPTNAGLAGDVWTILTGIDFKSEGCWRVTGEYQGQSLEFVVETVDYHEYRSQRQ